MDGYTNGTYSNPRYSLLRGAQNALCSLLAATTNQIPSEVKKHLQHVNFHTASSATSTSDTSSPSPSDTDGLYFPCPFKETEAAAALKAVEASAVAAIADLRYGEKKRKINIDLERTAAFLFSTYIATIGGLNKGHPKVKGKLKGEVFRFSLLVPTSFTA